MLYEKVKDISLLPYNPRQSGLFAFLKYKKNTGIKNARILRGNVLFWGKPITNYHIAVRKYRRLMHKFQFIGGIVFGLGFLGLFVYIASEREFLDKLLTTKFWFAEGGSPARTLFWFSIISFGYLFYRMIVTSEVLKSVEDLEQNKDSFSGRSEEDQTDNELVGDIKNIKKKHHHDISVVYTHEAFHALELAFSKAKEHKNKEVTPEHLFFALLQSTKMKGIFIRLNISTKSIEKVLNTIFSKQKDKSTIPVINNQIEQIIYYAYDEAYKGRQPYIHVTELILATVKYSERLQEMLYDLEVDKQKLDNVIEWVRVREMLSSRYKQQRRAARKRSKSGIDRAMTAVATPFLNTFSQDITLAAKFNHLEPCVARNKEIEEIFRVIEGGRQSVMLTGPHGVGKMSIIEGIAQLMIEDRVPKRLQDKRLVQLSTSSLIAGTTVNGAIERLQKIMHEISRAGNIILYINNIHDLVSISGGSEGLDVSEALSEYLGPGNFLTIATTTKEGFNKHIANSQVGSVFSRINIEQMDQNQAIQVLESKVGRVEYKHHIFFSYDGIAQAVKLSEKFLHDQILPESAISIMAEAASYTRRKKGENALVSGDDVAAIISEKTGIPTTSISEDESSKLLRLEEEMHKRVIGQDQAVVVVSSALRRARAEIRSTKRPIANFLFLGPTGVGKTELAKTIASIYFGGEERMIRIDMSEYQDKRGIYRLIGQPNQQGTGLLTEAVRQQPFSLVLLDEMEKADPNILNLFLQVFDDGRLTDSVGRVIDFTNTIIIATSNAGTQYVSDRLKENAKLEDIREELVRGELKKYYRPEFLNRFDGIVLFSALKQEEIKQIAKLMLKRVEKDLEKRGIGLKIEDSALEALAVAGFDPEFGARPMRRTIQDKIENQLADLILQNKLQRRDTIVIGEGLKIHIE